MGEPVWQEVPGEHRNALRRLIVTQGDTEPASVEQQRLLGQTVPERLRPAQPLPGERRGGPPPLGDGLPAPHATSAATAARRPRRCSSAASGDPDKPRILGAFNEPCTDWLSFFMFTYLHRPRRQVPAARPRRERRSIRSRAPRASCSPKRRTTCSSARRACSASSQRTARADEEATRTSDVRELGRHRSADDAEVPEPLVLALARPLRRRDLARTPRPSSPPASRAAPRRSSYEDHKALERHLRDGRRRRTAQLAQRGRAAAQRDERGAARRVRRGLPARRRQVEPRHRERTASPSSSTLPSRRFHRAHRHLRRTSHFDPQGNVDLEGRVRGEEGRRGSRRDADKRVRAEPDARSPSTIRSRWRTGSRAPQQGIKGRPVDFEYVKHGL